MNNIAKFDNWKLELAGAIQAIQQPRTNFELAHFVVGQHDTEPRRWAQCVLELQIKIQNLRRAEISRRRLKRKIEKLERKGTRKAVDKAQLLRIDLEDHSLAVIGAIREADALWAIYKSFGRTYSRKELNDSEEEYWQRRLDRQAMQDVNASGRVGVGNQDALRLIGRPIDPPMIGADAVERRFLEVGNAKILVAIPTLIDREQIRRHSLPCLKGWGVPGTFQARMYVVQGKAVADAYNDAARTALEDGADFLLCVEDDHLIPAGTFERLWESCRRVGARSIVGAWYPQKKEPRSGAAVIVSGGRRAYLHDDGHIHQVYGITQGFTLIPTSIFREIGQPWFVTTSCLTQDSYFSQQARDAGYKLYIDTSIRIKHVCRDTGRVYE